VELISELDDFRQGWVQLVNDNVRSSSGGSLSIVNVGFKEANDLGPFGDDRPDIFLFKTLNGATAEAMVIGWQVETAVGFAVNEDQHYIQEGNVQDLLRHLEHTASSPAWIGAMQIVLASFKFGVMIDDKCLAVVLSHYFMNEGSKTPKVQHLCDELLNSLIPFLKGFTYIGTSRVFGDLKTVERIRDIFGV
jgi:hypothetical protein